VENLVRVEVNGEVLSSCLFLHDRDSISIWVGDLCSDAHVVFASVE
jgi:hypothetical protein